MTQTVDDYIQRVIRQGDEGSRLLAQQSAKTLGNNEYVKIVPYGMDLLAALKIPETHAIVVHSSSGNPDEIDPASHAASLVERLVAQAQSIGAHPVAFANVIDSATGDLSLLTAISDAFIDRSHAHKLTIMNGENAILGERITKLANVSGTMISIIPLTEISSPSIFGQNEVTYAVFDPKGELVLMNSDGVGTKTEFYERAKELEGFSAHTVLTRALYDSLAMKADDTMKWGASLKVVSDVVETRGVIVFDVLKRCALHLGAEMGCMYILQEEDVANRLQGYHPGASPVFNISGSAVSVLNQYRIDHPLVPKPGQTVVAVRGRQPNPRSNGITSKRERMVALLGENWHRTLEGKYFLGYLASPSMVLYPAFQALTGRGLATSAYHMSGGAFDGKLARPLAKHGLHATLDNLFSPDKREYFFIGAAFATPETTYAKCPMGNDGFFTTDFPGPAIDILRGYGLDAKEAGMTENAKDGKTGVTLKAFNGDTVYFSGNQ